MAMTAAERQAKRRQRQAQRMTVLEREVAALRRRLADAEAEAERLAGMVCQHPSAAVDGGRCMACGADVW